MLPHHDTIAAPATAAGTSAIAVIRISGKDTFRIVDLIFRKKNKAFSTAAQKSHTIHLGNIVDGDEWIDEVLISLFKAPHSFTGEDVVEISCHGSPFIVKKIMELLLNHGVRTAHPGEFSLRAFLNGKIDLSQAEAVADLIASSSETALKLALNQMKGTLSNKINQLRDELIGFAALLELELDFSEEDVAFADRKQLKIAVENLRNNIQHLIKSFQTGQAIRQGVPVVIAGRPNAGKSTLLNALLDEERAIVSPIPGTTRDTIEEDLIIQGILFRFMDTAGLRHASDEIEQQGIERTLDKVGKARVIIYLFDMNELSQHDVDNDVNRLKEYAPEGQSRFILCANKSDLASEQMKNDFAAAGCILISAKDHIGLEELKNNLAMPFIGGMKEAGDVVIAHVRHLEALQKADDSLSAVLIGMESNLTHDLIAADLRHALNYLGEIAGTITTDDLLHTIFSRFCIGK
jgi:tRNA modification GTPase